LQAIYWARYEVNFAQVKREFDRHINPVIHSRIVGIANPLCILLRSILEEKAAFCPLNGANVGSDIAQIDNG
jgi:hypothetical protein